MKKYNPEIFEDHNHKKMTRLFWWAWLSSAVSIISIGALMLCLSAPAHAYGPYDAYAVEVIDGDTIKADIAIFPDLIYRTKVRVAGIDTPEIRTRNACEKALALKAKEFTGLFLSQTAGKFTVENVKQGKFAGRIIADVYTKDVSLSKALLQSGLAREYHGGKRLGWCQ